MRVDPGFEQRWSCGGGKGSSGKRRSGPLRLCDSAAAAESDSSPPRNGVAQQQQQPAQQEPTGRAADEEQQLLQQLQQLRDPVLVLGAGWVGSRVVNSLLDDGVPTAVTNRPGTDPSKKPPYFRPVDMPEPPERPAAARYEFDLSDAATWTSLPAPESLSAVITTFPLVEPEAFWEQYLGRFVAQGKPVICYSSTSVYQVDQPGQAVDEETPLRPTPRALGEQYAQDRGATTLTISGIFGDPRTPRAICTCLSTYTSAGGALNGRKRVNMVHVNDIVDATRVCLAKPQPGRRINVAGVPFFLAELIQHCKHPAVPDEPDTDLSSKCVESPVLLQELMPEGFDFVQPLTRRAGAGTPSSA